MACPLPNGSGPFDVRLAASNRSKLKTWVASPPCPSGFIADYSEVWLRRGTEHRIKHNLVGLLAFKQSLAAGVLDGGDTEIRLDGSRLGRFKAEINARHGDTWLSSGGMIGLGERPEASGPTTIRYVCEKI